MITLDTLIKAVNIPNFDPAAAYAARPLAMIHPDQDVAHAYEEAS